MLDTDAKIAWACRRGMLELDLLFEPFFKERYQSLTAEQQAGFKELLQCNDQELFNWFLKGEQARDEQLQQAVALIKAHAAGEH